MTDNPTIVPTITEASAWSERLAIKIRNNLERKGKIIAGIPRLRSDGATCIQVFDDEGHSLGFYKDNAGN